MKDKKYTLIQRIKRLENIVGQIYYTVEILKEKLNEEENKQSV